jgi:hypothetical protein
MQSDLTKGLLDRARELAILQSVGQGGVMVGEA